MTRILVVLIAAIGLFSASVAAASARQNYLISLEIISSGQPIAMPRVSARAGEIASVSATGSYDIHFVATPDPDHPGNVLVSTNIVIPLEHGQRRLSRTVSVAEGEDATFESPPQIESSTAQLTFVLNARSLPQ